MLIYLFLFYSVPMQVPINPYGKAKKMAEDMIIDFSKNSDMAVMILRLVCLGNLFDKLMLENTLSNFILFYFL